VAHGKESDRLAKSPYSILSLNLAKAQVLCSGKSTNCIFVLLFIILSFFLIVFFFFFVNITIIE
jgi:hypothetical protein